MYETTKFPWASIATSESNSSLAPSATGIANTSRAAPWLSNRRATTFELPTIVPLALTWVQLTTKLPWASMATEGSTSSKTLSVTTISPPILVPSAAYSWLDVAVVGVDSRTQTATVMPFVELALAESEVGSTLFSTPNGRPSVSNWRSSSPSSRGACLRRSARRRPRSRPAAARPVRTT